MIKQISFDKKIDFPTMIGEISAVSLEQDLKFINESSIEGNLLLTGKYKMMEASRIEEDFSYKIPVDISFYEKLDYNNSNIKISDFSYEIKNEKEMHCHIELVVEGIEILEEENTRECDGDSVEEKEVEIPIKESDNVEEEVKIDNKPFFMNMNENEETYGTFLVYMVRQNETVQSIIEKYSTTLEEVEKYNDLNNVGIGTKLIIPLLKNE